ncbi:MAG: cytochrome C oxidase subunit IV family protein [Actinobacteria bacterium]|nr:cytochrome C oxidase subunit IV family protein [Actinomycetota bacterium]
MSDQTIPNYQHVADGGDAAVEHGASDRTYVMVALFLAVMTAFEVATSYTKKALGPFEDLVLLTLMAIKFVCVALYFMHLKYDQALCKRVFFFGVVVASLVYCGMLATFHYWAPHFR